MKFTSTASDETLVEIGKTMTDPNRKMIQTEEKSRGSHFLRSQLLFFLETPGAISRRCTGLLQPMLCCFLDTARVRDGEQGTGDGLLISVDGVAMCCMILIYLDIS
jgi:hypothetical protein